MDPYHSQSTPLAGPSSIPPAIFLPPQPLPRPKQHLHSTQDLLSVFNLHPAYDKYVRPHVRPIGDTDPGKGKGKEREVPPRDTAQQGDDDDGGEKKKKKDSYRHLIKRTPGKHSTKKDSYFQTLMAVPHKQKMQIQPIDAKTLHEGFSVTLTGLPSYNKASLEGTDPKEKEAKRLKKERRKAEKEERLRLQQQQSGSNVSTPGGTSTPRAMATPGASGSLVRNVSVHTPTKVKPSAHARPSPSRPSTPKAAASNAQQRTASTPVPPHQPTASVAIARVTSNPVSAGGRPTQVNGSVVGNGNAPVERRGVKRELDAPPMPHGQGQGSATTQPRPQKKRRIGSSTPQPAPLQQPTPRGS